ncbi:galactokinase family protein [Staphylothermus hellenicus]|uniref:GHMP kinase n=1 Tax=Staphylothermus hellenicus (strain DSM 12710 / JCM 10830 / BK20S6-10-b1 / P8) TaxID=591019 RepID=D7D9G5_STAHD|nr:galactokinase family protein [Staphylothermus hellenicus]ADI32411.1 GHMP kinase [Staphylothermus hellenicus DSM 12710]
MADKDPTRYIVSEYKRFYGLEPEVIVSAPGRLDFLNTHQDYKGLPVVSIGINLRTYVAISRSPSNYSRIISLNMLWEDKGFQDIFRVENTFLRMDKWFGNYIRASMIALKQCCGSIGDVWALIYSDIPIGAGLASSAALLVAFIGGVNELYGLGLDRRDVAELAYHVEHDIMNIPCGRLDQYGSAYGGIVRIETKPPYNVEELQRINGVFVVLDSGIKHSTADIHPLRQAEINTGLRLLLQMNDLDRRVREKLAREYYAVKWDMIRYEEIKPYLYRLPVIPRKRIEFTFKMNDSTRLALEVLKGGIPSFEKWVTVLGWGWRDKILEAMKNSDPVLSLIGLTMNYQHILLRDLYDVSLPQIEKIRDAALSAGGLGAKISGAGLGGSLIVLAKDRGTAEKILRKALDNGAVRGWIVEIDSGLRREA